MGCPDLAAERKALRADPHAREAWGPALAAELSDRGPVRRQDQAGDVTPLLAAEAACGPWLGLDRQSRPAVRALDALDEDLVGQVDASLADEHPGPAISLWNCFWLGPTEAPRAVGPAFPDCPFAGSDVDDLMDPLVAEPECIGHLAKRSTRRVKLPDGVLVGNRGLVRLVLKVERAS